MGMWADLFGTTLSYFKIGTNGVRLKNSSGNLLVRNPGDTSYTGISASYFESPTEVIPFNSSILADLAIASRKQILLEGNITALDASNLKQGLISFTFIQDITGGWTVTFASKFKFPGGVAPALSIDAGARDTLLFDCDGTDLFLIHISNDIR